MATFQAKPVGKGRERERKKNSSRWVPTKPVIKNSKKIAKKFKKLKNMIMASLQAKISWERLRKRENNNNKKNRSNEFLPDP